MATCTYWPPIYRIKLTKHASNWFLPPPNSFFSRYYSNFLFFCRVSFLPLTKAHKPINIVIFLVQFSLFAKVPFVIFYTVRVLLISIASRYSFLSMSSFDNWLDGVVQYFFFAAGHYLRYWLLFKHSAYCNDLT